MYVLSVCGSKNNQCQKKSRHVMVPPWNLRARYIKPRTGIQNWSSRTEVFTRREH
jgi:hypothetical protein